MERCGLGGEPGTDPIVQYTSIPHIAPRLYPPPHTHLLQCKQHGDERDDWPAAARLEVCTHDTPPDIALLAGLGTGQVPGLGGRRGEVGFRGSRVTVGGGEKVFRVVT